MTMRRAGRTAWLLAALACAALAAPATAGASTLSSGVSPFSSSTGSLAAASSPLAPNATREIADEMVTVTPAGSVTYTGAPIEPEVRLAYGASELERGRDFIVTYLNNTQVGNARIIIDGKGEWSGRVSRDFAILPIDLENCHVAFASVPCPYVVGEEFDPPMQVTSGALLLERDRDYTLSAVLAGDSEAVVTVEGKGNFSGSKVVFVDVVAGVEVTFSDGYDSRELAKEAVAVGGSATPPTPPSHYGRLFAGWSKPYTNVTENTQVEAVYLPVSGEPKTIARKAGDTAKLRLVTLANGSEVRLLTDEGDVLSHGWRVAGGLVYYAGDDGLTRSGVLVEGDKRYFMGADGTRVTGWVSDPDTGARYYARPEDGTLATSSWFNDGFGWYYAGDDSVVQTGWMWKDGGWYWLNTEPGREYARMAFGWTFIDGLWYWFDESGVMGRNRWVLWNNAWYWLLSDGTMAQNRWVLINKWFYFLDGGAQAVGWLYDDGWYYLDVNDGMLTNRLTPDGFWVGADGRWVG